MTNLTNAHHYMYGVLAHGIPLDRVPAGFWPFLEEFWWPRVEDRLSYELIAAATDWACLEMVRSGVTTFYDCLEAPFALPGALEAEAEVVRRWGLRGVLSFEATQRVSAENGESGLRENSHFARRPVAYYEYLGVLGSHVLASQCVQVEASEIAILARQGVHVMHQPLSNCEVGGGFAPVPEMLAAGVNVALGMDGYVNNFFEVMRAAALMSKARLLEPGVMPVVAAWTMVTQNGVCALGFDDLGTLVPRNQADLLLIGADLPTALTPHNTADQLLLWRNPGDLRGLMCAGRWLL